MESVTLQETGFFSVDEYDTAQQIARQKSDSEHILYLGVFVVKSKCIGVQLVQPF